VCPITEQIKTDPAQGINPARHSLVRTAWNATSGDKVWPATPISSSTDTMSCGAFDGNLQNFSATLDGEWGVLQWPQPNSDVDDVIDLTSGKLYPRANLQGTLGNYVVTGVYHTPYGDDPNHVTLTLPGSWRTLGRFTIGSGGPDEVPLDEPGIFAPHQAARRRATGTRRRRTTAGSPVLLAAGAEQPAGPEAAGHAEPPRNRGRRGLRRARGLGAKEHGAALATRDARARGTYDAVGVMVIVVT
jgi:hypothetical protein